jgi:inner membrane protein
MDTFTHALSGALLARAAAPSRPHPDQLSPRARMAAGFAAAAAPDIDFALRLVDTLAYLNWHQGVTHSLVLMPAWAWLLAHLFSAATRRRHSWRAFFAPALLGVAIHISGDLITAYGTMLFAPFSTQRYALPIAFVIDPHLTVITAAGAAAAVLLAQRRYPAVVALIVLAGYVGFQAALQQRAVNVGLAYAAERGINGAEVHALPQPLTPFNRKILVGDREGYHEALVNLWLTRGPGEPGPEAGMLRRIAAGYQPVDAAHWMRHWRFGATPPERALAREAWQQEEFAGFRRFARFPVLDHIERDGGRVCVWFVDLRFTLPALPPSFRYGVCRAGPAEGWRLERLRGAFRID